MELFAGDDRVTSGDVKQMQRFSFSGHGALSGPRPASATRVLGGGPTQIRSVV